MGGVNGNIFNYSNPGHKQEVFDILLETTNLKIEKITGFRPYTEPGEWYDQELDEWVVLLQGSAVLEIKNEEIIELKAGDYIFLPAHKIHRINRTESIPKCIWLAIHGKLK